MNLNTAEYTVAPEPATFLVDGKLARAFMLMYDADTRRRQTGTDRWQFAIEIAELRSEGLHHADLRWLVFLGYAEHAEEYTRPSDQLRRFRLRENLGFGPNTCFVLTQKGAEVTALLAGLPTNQRAGISVLDRSEPLRYFRPSWHTDRRELTLGGRLVKGFRVPAPNQERILAAFEEESWPPRIDDPLFRTPQIDPRVRLHETIRSLNQHQSLDAVRFSGDGTGQGIKWALVSQRSPIDLP